MYIYIYIYILRNSMLAAPKHPPLMYIHAHIYNSNSVIPKHPPPDMLHPCTHLRQPQAASPRHIPQRPPKNHNHTLQ